MTASLVWFPQVHPSYRQAVLGAAVNGVAALAALALQPALAGSALQGSVLEAACGTELLPCACALLAHAAPAPAAGQGVAAWYEQV